MTIRILRFAKAPALILAPALLCGANGPSCDNSRIPVGYDDAAAQPATGNDASPPTSVSPGMNPAPVGGCPGTEPAGGSACSIRGRLCTWTRSCGSASTVDTGWCLGSGTWRVAQGICKDGCPAERPAPMFGALGGANMAAPPPGDASSNAPTGTAMADAASCTLGTQCLYPSTPLDSGGIQCTCSVQSDGTLYWGSGGLCNAWNDGWVPASGGGASQGCGELLKCSGSSGCADTCPVPSGGATYRSCGCGEDGLYYCSVNPC